MGLSPPSRDETLRRRREAATAQTSAMRARYGLTPRHVASSRLAAHERREGLRTARTARWVGLRGRRAMPALLCRRHRLRWQLRWSAGDAMVAVVLTGTRGRNVG